MGAISERAQESEGTYVSIIGHSRTGKTTRATCLSEQLDPNGLELRPCYRVTHFGQTRNICLGVKYLRNVSRFGSIFLTYLDYPGQDHLPAYYTLQGMAEVFRQLSSLDQKKGLRALENLKTRAMKVAEAFLSPNVKPEEALETIVSVIRDPFEPFKHEDGGNVVTSEIVARVIASASFVAKEEILERYEKFEEKLTENIERLLEYAGCASKQEPKLDIINAINWLLCEMEAPKEVCRKNGTYRGAIESFDISSDIKDALKDTLKDLPHRFRITGPLIAYLVLGLLLKSRVIIFTTPIRKEAWYWELYNTYKDTLQSIGGFGRATLLSLIRQYFDRRVISDRDFNLSCVEALTGVEKENMCTNLARLIRDGRLKYAEELLEKLSEDDVKKLLSLVIGEAMRTFHFGFIDLLLSLLEEFSKNKSKEKRGQSRKDVIFLLTYHEGLKYPESLDRLGGDVPPRYFDSFRNTLRSVRRSLEAELDVYMVPSSINSESGSSGDGREAALSICTGVEAALLHCVLEGSQTKVLKICREGSNPGGGKDECRTFRCVDLEKAFRYDTWSYRIG